MGDHATAMSEPRDSDVDIDNLPGTESEPDSGAPTGEDLPVGLRVGRDPSNLGDEIPSAGDVTSPDPVGETPQM